MGVETRGGTVEEDDDDGRVAGGDIPNRESRIDDCLLAIREEAVAAIVDNFRVSVIEGDDDDDDDADAVLETTRS